MRTLPISILSTYLLLICTFSVSAQLTKQWENHYISRADSNLVNSLNTNIHGDKLQFDATGNCYFLSQVVPPNSNSSGSSNHSVMQVTKYNSSGSTLWIQKDSGLTYNYCCGLYPIPAQMIVDNNGSFFLSALDGYPFQGDPTHYFNSSTSASTINWSYSTSGDLYQPDVIEDIHGNFGVATLADLADGFLTIVMSKINSSGNFVYVQRHAAPGGNAFNVITITTDDNGNFYTITNSFNNQIFLSKIWVSKYDSDGSVIWEKNVDSGNVPSDVVDLIYNPVDKNLYASYSILQTGSSNQISLAKLSTAGNVQWIKTNGSNHNATKIKQDKQGNIYLWFGSKYGWTLNQTDIGEGTIVKYNSAGNEIARMDGGSFAIDASGYVYANHTIRSNNNFYHAIKKYSPDGILLFDVTNRSSPANTTFEEVYCDDSDNLYALTDDSAPDTIRVTKYKTKCTATSTPAKPAPISGSKIINCNSGSDYVYSCATVSKAIYYNWTVPPGVTIVNGQGTNQITIRHSGNSFKKGKISVYAANCFAAGDLISISVTDTLKKPGALSGAVSVCKNQTNVQYSVPAVDGAVYYQWSVPNDASFSSGYKNGLTTLPVVKINFGTKSGNVTVFAMNGCDSSAAKTLHIDVTKCAGLNSVAGTIKQNLIVYPNPSNNIFTLQFSDNLSEHKNHQNTILIIKDVAGRNIRQINCYSNTVQFGKNLVPGIYLVEVISKGQKQVLKIVKE